MGRCELRDAWANAGAQQGAEGLDAVQRGCAVILGYHLGPHLAGSRSRAGIGGRMLH